MSRRKAWEPWRPQPGQRVQVRLSGECRKRWGGPNPLGHAPEQQGVLGVVVEHCTQPWCDLCGRGDHPYPVRFDREVLQQRDGYPFRANGSHFAAIELDPA